MKRVVLGGISLFTALLLGGCGSSAGGDGGEKTAVFIDSFVAGIEYNTSSGIKGVTDSEGNFRYRKNDKVEFHLGKLKFGCANVKDGVVTPEDFTDKNATLTLTLQVLQSLDADSNTSNGIQIPKELKTGLNELNKEYDIQNLDAKSILDIDSELSAQLDRDFDGEIDVNASTAYRHFIRSKNKWKTKHAKQKKPSEFNDSESVPVIDVNSYPLYTLTPELKNALAYMGNEERLAYDVYKNLYEYYSDEGLKPLINIAERSESRHIATVRSLVEKYNITPSQISIIDRDVVGDENTSVDSVRGEYDIEHIQQLYDLLYAKGIASKKDALEVGCMVEVTDINDLDEYITQAKEAGAEDIADAFEALKKGSYNHYWAFDNRLKSMGVEDGCCALGEIDGVNYCHPEYPKNSKGSK